MFAESVSFNFSLQSLDKLGSVLCFVGSFHTFYNSFVLSAVDVSVLKLRSNALFKFVQCFNFDLRNVKLDKNRLIIVNRKRDNRMNLNTSLDYPQIQSIKRI